MRLAEAAADCRPRTAWYRAAGTAGANEWRIRLHVAGAGPAQVVAVAPAARDSAALARLHRAGSRRPVRQHQAVAQLLLVVPTGQPARVDAAVAVSRLTSPIAHRAD